MMIHLLYVVLAMSAAQSADITGDGFVEAEDLGALLGAWGWTADPGMREVHAADLNRDMSVDAADLGLLLGAWGDVHVGAITGPAQFTDALHGGAITVPAGAVLAPSGMEGVHRYTWDTPDGRKAAYRVAAIPASRTSTSR